jgi:Putative metallopeptidase
VRRLAVVLIATAALATAAATTSDAQAPNGRFVVQFAPPRNADERLLVQLLRAAQLPQVFTELGKHLKLPRNIFIRVQGGQAGPYYNPANRTIVLNHPFSALVLNVFQKEYPKITPHRLGELFAELEYFVLFHEVGHALVDQWDLPVVGREEDAVDAFSTIFMTEFVNEGEFALAGADFFYYLAGTHQLDEVDFADEHSFDKQRAYSIACWVYGSNPTRYGFLRQFLPVSRRVRCADEYRKLKKAWFSFLRPHIRA